MDVIDDTVVIQISTNINEPTYDSSTMEIDSDGEIESGSKTDVGGETDPYNKNQPLKLLDQRRLNDMVRDLLPANLKNMVILLG